jgi:hypothetical protein
MFQIEVSMKECCLALLMLKDQAAGAIIERQAEAVDTFVHTLIAGSASD